MTIDINKKYKTNTGDNVRILCVDRPGPFPVVGLVGDQLIAWRANGISASGYTHRDLVEVVPTVWRTIGHTTGATDTYVSDGRDVLFVGALACDTLEELRERLPYYKFAGEFRGEELLRTVNLHA